MVAAEASKDRRGNVEKFRPDVALLDLWMPVWTVAAIQNLRPMFSPRYRAYTYDTDNEILRAIKAGAKVPLKDLPREELVDCIRKVHRGDTCITPSSWRNWRRVTARPYWPELDVLTLLADGKGAIRRSARGFLLRRPR